MTTLTFDSLGYVRKLEECGFTRQQAEVQTEFLREQAEMQAEALRRQAEEQRAALQRELQQAVQRELDRYDEASRKELATKGDVQDVRLEIEKVRAEIEKVRADLGMVKYDLLKWQIGGWIALATIMAKGFGWLGF